MKNNSGRILLFLSFLVVAVSCVKRDFDEPPYIDETTDLVANTTISELKALHSGAPLQIQDDLIISGIVIADDRSGNFFKSIIIQDADAGIDIQIDRVALHDEYPIGRKIFVKCKDLWIANNNGVLQLGASIDPGTGRAQRIPDNLRSKFLFRGARNQQIDTLSLSVAQLNATHIHRLVRLRDVQFIAADTGKTLANAAAQLSVNLNLEDCSGEKILLRTSGFASFANAIAPGSKGDIIAVYSVFGNDKQLFIREIEDIKFNATRCGSSSGGNLISIESLRAVFQGTATTAPLNSKVKATVISDRINSNITTRNIVIQEPAGAGIVVRFNANNTFALGDEIELEVSGLELSEFNGLLQLNNVPNANARKTGEGNLPVPLERTIAQILSEFENLESRLVKIRNVSITKSSGNTYSGTCVLNDGTGSIDLFTQSYAEFAGVAFPTSTVDLVGIVAQGGTQSSRQIMIRNTNDVQAEDIGGEFFETFSGVPDNVDLNLAGWRNIAQTGSRLWRGRMFSGNGYAQATSFNSTDPVNVMWLITPGINLDQAKWLSFETAQSFWRHNALEVFISTNFTGNNLATANWQKLDGTIATSSDPENTFIESGDINLSSFSGEVHIGFKYSGDNATNTSTYRIDNVRVRNQ